MLPVKVENITEVQSYIAPERYEVMLQETNTLMPKIMETIESFNKASSQLKTVTLDINDLTEIGTAKHIVAAIDQTRKALKESEISVKRKEIEIKRKEKQLETASGFDADELEIDLLELDSQLEDVRASQRGALRRMTFLAEQYRAICDSLGVEVVTEEMYEENEPKYHVMRAMSQALAAARARGGLIDEGNFIYFQDLGINGAAMQRELIAYLEMEQNVLNDEHVPTFEMQMSWLDAIGEKFKGEVGRYAQARNLNPRVDYALAQKPTLAELES